MMLTTKGRYAVMALVDLATHSAGKPVGLASISQRQEIPLNYLEQIFARLKRAALVSSVRGPGGGYKLARAVDAMSVAEIMIASDEPIKMTRCASHSHNGCTASKARCATHDLWEGLSAQINHYLGSITLADVAAHRVQQKFPRAHAEPGMMMFMKGESRVQSPEFSKKRNAEDRNADTLTGGITSLDSELWTLDSLS